VALFPESSQFINAQLSQFSIPRSIGAGVSRSFVRSVTQIPLENPQKQTPSKHPGHEQSMSLKMSLKFTTRPSISPNRCVVAEIFRLWFSQR
jgi:hypothetical protein